MSSSEPMSEGFDLDALPAASQDNNEVIYEIGGSATQATTGSGNVKKEQHQNEHQQQQQQQQQTADVESPIFKSEEFKRQGNEFFKKKDYLNAYDMYSDAIDACPGMNGEEILQLKEDHELNEREKANERYLRDTDRRRHKRGSSGQDQGQTDDNDNDNDNDNENDNKDGDKFTPNEFEVPPHEYGTKLAVYHSNRAACLLHENRYEEAIKDCNIAVYLNPKYTKAYIRRMTAYEETDQTEEALRDAKSAIELDPNNRDIKKHVLRLQKVEDERMEKLKEETMGKLKDLGNSILGNFGLSLDNFQAKQDPNTGSYNISFGNN
jgi:tetratricopeptide (TPR) repeat protein